MTSKNDVSEHAVEIQTLLAKYESTLAKKDVDGVLSCMTSDLVTYSLAPPLIWPTDGGKSLQAWFNTWNGDISYELHDLKICAGDDIAFAHGLTHMAGTKLDGDKPDLWFRQTFGLRRIGSNWRITHDHMSVPFYMDGSFKAAVDLQPKS
jgi:ketosteroid isomerase-like protein